MKRSIKVLALIALMPVAVMAQSELQGEEVDAMLDQMYQETQQETSSLPDKQTTNETAASTQVQVTVQAQPQLPAQDLNVQKQPTTYIEASPLTESRVERLRKARQETELLTEQSIVEKLEQSRMEDEKRRADALFGNQLNQIQGGTQTQQVQTVPVVVPEQVVAPQPEVDREAIRGEVSAALAEMKEAEPKKPEAKSYFGAMVGMGEYPDAVNIRGQYSLGFAFGQKFDDRLVVEGSFQYSNFQVEQREGYYDPYSGVYYPRITEMDQYSGSALVKYQLLGGVVRPTFGALASYTFRSFTDTQFSVSDDEATSHALDMGLMTGADLELSEKMSIGIDFRYMWNLTSRVNNGFQRSYIQPYLRTDVPVERLNYYVLSIMARASF